MKETADDEPTPVHTPVHAGFTMEQVKTHFNTVMTEVHPAPPVSAFRISQEDQRYNLDLLVHHQLVQGQIYG